MAPSRWLRFFKSTKLFVMKAIKSITRNPGSSSQRDDVMKNRLDNDEIYKKFRQVIRDDGLVELKTDSQEFQLLARLGHLTYERFLERIAPFMTPERSSYVRKLRVDDGLTWRGVAEAWEEEFESVAEWNFDGNQLAGMALCEVAAKFFDEDYVKPPWN